MLAAAIECAAASETNGSIKLYVSNSLSDDITVIDLGTLQVTGDIRVGEHVHGVCAPENGRQLFTTIESEKNLNPCISALRLPEGTCGSWRGIPVNT
jgi:YVTN family beta-propeller protein